ncbi:MAG: hypothetical protein IBX56_07705 [Methylomicrobium sp.]|nr:hypothetical protein [Methylomicrobium sp.]
MSLRADINRLIDTDDTTERVGPATARPAIDLRIGQSRASTANAPTPQGGQLVEVLTLWSPLIVTELGAFERPPNWPDSGNYSGSAFELDTTLQFYEQRRVHASYFLDQDRLISQFYLVALASPFGGFINTPEQAAGLSFLNLFVDSAGSTNPSAIGMLNYLLSLGAQ